MIVMTAIEAETFLSFVERLSATLTISHDSIRLHIFDDIVCLKFCQDVACQVVGTKQDILGIRKVGKCLNKGISHVATHIEGLVLLLNEPDAVVYTAIPHHLIHDFGIHLVKETYVSSILSVVPVLLKQ